MQGYCVLSHILRIMWAVIWNITMQKQWVLFRELLSSMEQLSILFKFAKALCSLAEEFLQQPCFSQGNVSISHYSYCWLNYHWILKHISFMFNRVMFYFRRKDKWHKQVWFVMIIVCICLLCIKLLWSRINNLESALIFKGQW